MKLLGCADAHAQGATPPCAAGRSFVAGSEVDETLLVAGADRHTCAGMGMQGECQPCKWECQQRNNDRDSCAFGAAADGSCHRLAAARR